MLATGVRWHCQVQEFRTGATRGTMDAIHTKEETTRLRNQIGDLRGKLSELENRVSSLALWVGD